jgi:lactate dehydrogenase-like 2-hydroxyacid dehydrogenase
MRDAGPLFQPTAQERGRRSEYPWGAVFHGTFESLLEITDCLVLACPLTERTYHMLSRREFEIARPGLRVVNIATGKIIDEKALVKVPAVKKVIRVSLDVMEFEPVVNPELRNDYLVSLLPHVGVCSRPVWEEFEGRNWANAVDFFYSSRKGITPVNTQWSQKSNRRIGFRIGDSKSESNRIESPVNPIWNRLSSAQRRTRRCLEVPRGT